VKTRTAKIGENVKETPYISAYQGLFVRGSGDLRLANERSLRFSSEGSFRNLEI
jgi:hypothetical protein